MRTQEGDDSKEKDVGPRGPLSLVTKVSKFTQGQAHASFLPPTIQHSEEFSRTLLHSSAQCKSC